MKKILVPTDFSSTAHAAMDYALKLSEYWENTTITVVHCFMPVSGMDYPGIIPPVNEIMAIKQNALKHFVHKDPAIGGTDIKTAVKIETDLVFGFPGEELTRLSYNYDYIVMGTTGESDVLLRWLGSVSSTVAKRSHCPVILVPEGEYAFPPRHIAYAANPDSVRGPLIKALMEFNQPFGASIHFLHVKDQYDFTPIEVSVFEEIFKKEDPSIAFEMREIEGEDKALALGEFIQEQHIDLLVMSHQQRNYWDAFFHHSLTKEMVQSIHVPLLTLHN